MLPLVVAEAHGDALQVTVNGDKDHAETVTRAGLGTTLARVVANLGVPTRIEIHEQDGRVLADILQPPAPEPEKETQPDAETPGPARADEPQLVEVYGEDFVPGEDVAVAVILRHTSADGTGHARALLDLTAIPGGAGAEVVMVGRISKEVAVRSLT